MRRVVLSWAALLSLGIAFGLGQSSGAAAPTCFGKPATHVMQRGDPQYTGTAGNDVVVGSSGKDDIFLITTGGTDFVCGEGGADVIEVSGTGDIADGGTGNDFVRSRFGALSRGGAGDDIAIALDGGTTDGGSGNDIVRGAEAAALYGGSGSDRVESTSGDPTIDCGSGTDTVVEDADPSGRRCERAETFP